MSDDTTNKKTRQSPAWWTDAMSDAWEMYHAREGQTQAVGHDQVPDSNPREAQGDEQNVSPDKDRWYEAARFGFGVSSAPPYQREAAWNDSMEARLRDEWDTLKTGQSWDEVKGAVRGTWERVRNHKSR